MIISRNLPSRRAAARFESWQDVCSRGIGFDKALIVDVLCTSLTLWERSFLLASRSGLMDIGPGREAGLSAYPPTGLPALPFFRERCTMLMIVSATAILAAVTGGVVVAAWHRRKQKHVDIDMRLRAFCAR